VCPSPVETNIEVSLRTFPVTLSGRLITLDLGGGCKISPPTHRLSFGVGFTFIPQCYLPLRPFHHPFSEWPPPFSSFSNNSCLFLFLCLGFEAGFRDSLPLFLPVLSPVAPFPPPKAALFSLVKWSPLWGPLLDNTFLPEHFCPFFQSKNPTFFRFYEEFETLQKKFSDFLRFSSPPP